MGVSAPRWDALLAAALLLTVACGPLTAVGGGPTPSPGLTAAAADTFATREAEPAAPRRFTLLATGDVLIHGRVRAAAETPVGFDFRPLLAETAPEVAAADLALCHLEVPLSADGRRLSGYPLFNAPPEVATALAAVGFDGCSTASNHSVDRGADGVVATLDVLDGAGLGHAGTARSAAEAGPGWYRPAGVTVAHLSYTYGLNGLPVPAGRPWMVALIDPDRILEDAAAARSAGAEFVVVSLHWGAEYRHTPTAEQEALAQRLLSTGAVDLIIGHHAHVVQPLERIGGRLVAYGLGNFLSGQTPRCCPRGTDEGVVLVFHIEEGPGGWRTASVDAVPTWVDPEGYRVRVVHRALQEVGPDAPQRHALLRAATRTLEVLQSRGVAVDSPLWTTTRRAR